MKQEILSDSEAYSYNTNIESEQLYHTHYATCFAGMKTKKAKMVKSKSNQLKLKDQLYID